MKPEPLKNKVIEGVTYRMGTLDKYEFMVSLKDVKSAVEWLKKQLFIEGKHLKGNFIEFDKNCLLQTIDETFQGATKSKEKEDESD